MEKGITTEEFVALLQLVLKDKELPDTLENGGLPAGVMEAMEPAEAAGGMVLDGSMEALKSAGAAGGMVLARRHGWVEAQDLAAAGEPVRRQAAARIIHEFLWRELGEKDVIDISPAFVLKDIYDCHACVNHVAQVYCKGLMGASHENCFGMQECVSKEQACEIAERLRFRMPSNMRTALDGAKFAEKEILEGNAFLRIHPDTIHIDVRTAFEYEKGHPKGAINLPLVQLLEQPEKVSENKEACILVGCDGGYRSEIAAQCLSDAGYSRVYHYRFS